MPKILDQHNKAIREKFYQEIAPLIRRYRCKDMECEVCSGYEKKAWKFIETQNAQLIEKVKERLKRLKLEFDVCICDCGEPLKDTDAYDILQDILNQLCQNTQPPKQ